MSDPAPTAPAAPSDPASAVPASGLSPAPDAPDAPAGPSAAERSAITKVKVAGMIMLLLGGFFLVNGLFALFFTTPYESAPGGLVDIAAPDWGHAHIRIDYADGNATATQFDLDDAGTGSANVTFAKFTLTATQGNRSAVFTGLVPIGAGARTSLTQSADGNVIGYTEGALRSLVIIVTVVTLVIAVGGLAAFRRRGYNMALAGAGTYLLGGLYLAYATLSLPGLLFGATAGLCVWFVLRGRPHITPGWAFWAR